MLATYDVKTDISNNKLLNELNENEIFQLCTVGKVGQYNFGDILFKQGDSDQTLYLILQGSIKLTQNSHANEKIIKIIEKDDGLGDAEYVEESLRTVTALVEDPSTIMVIDRLRMDMIPPEIKFRIYKNLYKNVSEYTNNVICQDTELTEEHKLTRDSIKSIIHSNVKDYNQSELIHGILENIPSLPMYTTNLVMLLQEEQVSINEIVEQTQLDPSLVGVILKTINSAYYSLRCKISDVQHAITYLGFNQVYQLVIDHGVKSTMPNTPDFHELQSHSSIVSIISFELSRLCNKQKPVMLGTIGLLHDVGKSVILLMKRQNPKMSILIDKLDYACLGSLLLSKWNVPDDVSRTIEYQRFPEYLPPSEIPVEYVEKVAILHIAHLCYEFATGKGEEELPLAYIEKYMKLLGFSKMPFSQLFHDIIMPAVFKKTNSYPENIRNFFNESILRDLRSMSNDETEFAQIL
jgi:HD-like signal output (HDOD) protein/CRP-like cAMP-binding protein